MHLVSDFDWPVYVPLYEWFNCSFALLRVQNDDTAFSSLHLIFININVHLF